MLRTLLEALRDPLAARLRWRAWRYERHVDDVEDTIAVLEGKSRWVPVWFASGILSYPLFGRHPGPVDAQLEQLEAERRYYLARANALRAVLEGNEDDVELEDVRPKDQRLEALRDLENLEDELAAGRDVPDLRERVTEIRSSLNSAEIRETLEERTTVDTRRARVERGSQ